MNKIHPSIQLVCDQRHQQCPNPFQSETYLSVAQGLIDDNDTQEQHDTLKRIKQHPIYQRVSSPPTTQTKPYSQQRLANNPPNQHNHRNHKQRDLNRTPDRNGQRKIHFILVRRDQRRQMFRGISNDREEDQPDPFMRERRVRLDEPVDTVHEELGGDTDERGNKDHAQYRRLPIQLGFFLLFLLCRTGFNVLGRSNDLPAPVDHHPLAPLQRGRRPMYMRDRVSNSAVHHLRLVLGKIRPRRAVGFHILA